MAKSDVRIFFSFSLSSSHSLFDSFLILCRDALTLFSLSSNVMFHMGPISMKYFCHILCSVHRHIQIARHVSICMNVYVCVRICELTRL